MPTIYRSQAQKSNTVQLWVGNGRSCCLVRIPQQRLYYHRFLQLLPLLRDPLPAARFLPKFCSNIWPSCDDPIPRPTFWENWNILKPLWNSSQSMIFSQSNFFSALLLKVCNSFVEHYLGLLSFAVTLQSYRRIKSHAHTYSHTDTHAYADIFWWCLFLHKSTASLGQRLFAGKKQEKHL